ncbi:DinB family protein [Streptomyces sp. SID13031]|uniref:DinB family protein n=1 Tax=Streptomyces sp. SID13031 TaxID=2706046 RepID=UPI0013C7810C|nr:DinB family protein [Streptomyces sp. SID13031]NEA31974.1 DinB family protein [Streptomyces sp. SID13031]
MVDLKAELLRVLQSSRAVLLAKLDGLPEYDRRRPLTPTGTNLLGLVKHLAGLEYGYLGDAFGRPPLERPSWFRDDPYTEIDMWATPDESTDYITGVYRQACTHSDLTITELDLNTPGHVAHWALGHQETTLAVLLIRMTAETSQHAGHADIIRELIDSQTAPIGNAPARPTRRESDTQGATSQVVRVGSTHQRATGPPCAWSSTPIHTVC